jgi:putative glutamine amidotransferase
MKPRVGVTATPAIHDDRLVDEINRSYLRAVVDAGGVPLVLPVLDPCDAPAVIEGLDGLLLSGGGDIEPSRYGQLPSEHVDGVDPARDAWELALIEAALARDLPILGICRGAQLLNIAWGGSLVQHLPDVTEQSHRERERFADEIHAVELLADSRVAQAMSRTITRVNTLHHQAVDQVGTGLRIVGYGDDGTVEAIEAIDGSRAIGVQWHPELLPHLPGNAELFCWLVAESGSRSELRVVEAVA